MIGLAGLTGLAPFASIAGASSPPRAPGVPLGGEMVCTLDGRSSPLTTDPGPTAALAVDEKSLGDLAPESLGPRARAELVAGVLAGSGDTPAATARELLEAADPNGFVSTLEHLQRIGALAFVSDALAFDPTGPDLTALGRSIAPDFDVDDLLWETGAVVRGLSSFERAHVLGIVGEAWAEMVEGVRLVFVPAGSLPHSFASAMAFGRHLIIDPTAPGLGFAAGTTRPRGLDLSSLRSRSPDYLHTLLGHEMLHALSFGWQGLRYGLESITDQLAAIGSGGDRSGAYGYDADGDLSRLDLWQDLREEQRALWFEDYLRARFLLLDGRGDDIVFAGGASPTQITARAFVARSAPLAAQLATPPNGGTLDPLAAEDADRSALVLIHEGLADLGSTLTSLAESDVEADRAIGVVGLLVAYGATILDLEELSAGNISGPGSAVLAQLGLPTGVRCRVEGEGATKQLRVLLDYGPGFRDPAVAVSARAVEDQAGLRRTGTLEARIPLGDPSAFSAAFSATEVGADNTSGFSLRYAPEDELRIVRANVFHTGPESATGLAARFTWHPEGRIDAEVDGDFEIDPLTLSFALSFAPTFQRLVLDVGLRGEEARFEAGAAVTQAGLDALRVRISGDTTTASLAATGLSDEPAMSFDLTHSQGGGSLEVSLQTSRDRTAIGMSATIPVK